MGIIAIANDSEDCSLNPCLKMNGGCQERCGVRDNGTIDCSCFTGKQLAKDLKSCELVKEVENITCSNDEFKCKTGKCIPNTLLCDLDIDCPDKDGEIFYLSFSIQRFNFSFYMTDEDVELCLKMKCKQGQFKCVKAGACIDSRLVCDGEIECPGKKIYKF